MPVPVIDLFAGPGGLGEGFSRAQSASFQIAVSIEKDEMAFDTLRLRAAHRALFRLGAGRSSWSTWDDVVATAPWNVVFDTLRSTNDAFILSACAAATRETWNLELGPENRALASAEIRRRVLELSGKRKLPDNLVLIGGPPCQAYSIVGRSRNRGTEGYEPANDHRHFLYLEYLSVINEFRPALFVMENVKGILSSEVKDKQIFRTITHDLKRPDIACGQDTDLEYVLVALPKGAQLRSEPSPWDYVVDAEKYGVPQARHRVIICGVRRDVFDRVKTVRKLRYSHAPTVGDVILDLPRLRAQLSYRGKGQSWRTSLQRPLMAGTLKELKSSSHQDDRELARTIEREKSKIEDILDPGSGSDRFLFIRRSLLAPKALARWYRDRATLLLSNHESRAHMPDDLVRYLFVATYGRDRGESPRLAEFPRTLLPNHKNIDLRNPADAIFKDRFRVQLASRVAMTVTSHICKDGHAFVHPDPSQCRSLTVREAARLQTFPDTYVFLGNRTSQYTQVGNAVPPYLARQIANIVGDVLRRAGMAG
jgi:DNA (cytosine-5)-methyltransferase 1